MTTKLTHLHVLYSPVNTLTVPIGFIPHIHKVTFSLPCLILMTSALTVAHFHSFPRPVGYTVVYDSLREDAIGKTVSR